MLYELTSRVFVTQRVFHLVYDILCDVDVTKKWQKKKSTEYKAAEKGNIDVYRQRLVMCIITGLAELLPLRGSECTPTGHKHQGFTPHKIPP